MSTPDADLSSVSVTARPFVQEALQDVPSIDFASRLAPIQSLVSSAIRETHVPSHTTGLSKIACMLLNARNTEYRAFKFVWCILFSLSAWYAV